MTPALATRPLRIGLTGGIASGKSTVADMFAARGAHIIDTDVLARRLVAPGQPALAEIREKFGPAMIGPDGTLRRDRLRKRIFGDEALRQALEDILHPRIREAALAEAESGRGPYQLIVVPLLVGSPMRAMMDRILVVDCSEQLQLERLMQRDTESIEQARRMIAAQAGREERLAIADDVIRNDGSLQETERRVEELHRRHLQLAAPDTAPAR